jgi:hypothetical protein
MIRTIGYDQLSDADLVVDAVYEGRAGSHLAVEPLSRLLPGIGNLGGFRAAGRGADKKFVVLYTSGEDKDWPDVLDLSTGQFVYFGDNKKPGHELHDTSPGGNRILKRVFELLHGSPPDRVRVPPFFVFQKFSTGVSARSVQFKGLAVPGSYSLPATADLVAVWKTTAGQRFQNYRSTFTILDAPVIARAWLRDLESGKNPLTSAAPRAWSNWVNSGRYEALAAESTTIIRTAEAQTPSTVLKIEILEAVWSHFKEAPHSFERFAARLFQMQDPRVIVDAVTRASVDGGRDAFGRYLLGLGDDPIYAEFSLEAKCYRPGIRGMTATSVGVTDVSRLISRIKHRQFGVLVTTSFIARQAYQEVREDRHPIIFFSGNDIAETLIRSGFNTVELVGELLAAEFSLSTKAK